MKIIKGNFTDLESGETQDEDSLYSKMMYELIQPYVSKTPRHDELEDLLSKGMIAWNMANLKSAGLPVFDKVFLELLKNSGIDKKGKALIDKMIKTKEKQFDNFRNFVEDFEISANESGVAIIKIISTRPEDLSADENMDDDLDDLDFDMDVDQYEEGIVNREAIIVRPKESFYKWLEEKDLDFIPRKLSDGPIVYLIEENDDDKKTTRWLKKNFDKIFTNELYTFEVSPDDIAEKRTYKMFTDLFEIERHEIIVDLEEEPVVKI